MDPSVSWVLLHGFVLSFFLFLFLYFLTRLSTWFRQNLIKCEDIWRIVGFQFCYLFLLNSILIFPTGILLVCVFPMDVMKPLLIPKGLGELWPEREKKPHKCDNALNA